MDEWFVNLEVEDDRTLKGVIKVPEDQAFKLKESPLVLRSHGETIKPLWDFQGTREDGRSHVSLSAELGSDFQALTIELPQGLLDENQSLVGFIRFGTEEPSTILVAPGGSTTVERPKESGRKESVSDSATGFFKLGVTHISEGYDHILFLFCLLIAGGTLKHFLVVVTSFTLGHSITLAASVLGFISLPSQFTETVIALSIVIAALLNIPWLKKEQSPEDNSTLKSRGMLAGGFGLIHGLGFAGILKEIGIEGSGVAAPLLGFNLGVEAGQLALVIIFFPILSAINKWEKRVTFLTGCSYLAAAIGTYWVFERLGII